MKNGIALELRVECLGIDLILTSEFQQIVEHKWLCQAIQVENPNSFVYSDLNGWYVFVMIIFTNVFDLSLLVWLKFFTVKQVVSKRGPMKRSLIWKYFTEKAYENNKDTFSFCKKCSYKS